MSSWGSYSINTRRRDACACKCKHASALVLVEKPAVVVGMQTVDENAASSAIGYIIPAAQLSRIWPPPKD